MRSRNLKPGYFKNEILASLDPLARILYAGLWCMADREGRFEWRPKRIKAEILPYDDCDIDELLMSLNVMTFLDKYLHDNTWYGFIPKFIDHQKPHPHEAKSRIPDPYDENSEIIQPDRNTVENVIKCHDMSLNVTAECHSSSLIPSSQLLKARPPQGSALPSSEKTNESLETKIQDDLGEVCMKMKSNGFKRAFALKNKMLKSGKNPKAILHALNQCLKEQPKDPWGYCIKILEIEDGNYNAMDHVKKQKAIYKDANDPKHIGEVFSELKNKTNTDREI